MSHFPVLDRLTLLPTGRTLPLSDIFNPLLNTEYLDTAGYNASNGNIQIGDYISLCKTLAEHAPFSDFLEEVAKNRGIAMEQSLWADLVKYVVRLIPINYLYLVPQMSLHYSETLHDSVHNETLSIFEVRFLYPESVHGRESVRRNVKIPLRTHKVADMVYDPIPRYEETFKTDLTAALASVETSHTAWAGSVIATGDNLINIFVSAFYKFANNRPIFWPSDATCRSFGIYSEFMRPSQIRDFVSDPAEVRVSSRNGWRELKLDIKVKPGDRRALSQILNYSANVLDYLPYTIKGPKEPTATLYGVELEACSDYYPKDIIDAQKDLFFIMKSDSTITGNKSQCYEMVTVPASLRAHKRLWAEFFEKVDYRKFDTTKDTGNGMHVHIDRKAFTHNHLNRFTWFIINPANKDFLFAVSERPTKRNLEMWANTPNCLDRGSKVSVSRRATAINGSMRGAIHYKGTKTVEIRIFKGIVSYATVVKNLEFVDSLVEFTRNVNTTQVTLKNYFDWLSTLPSNKYTVLRAFFTEAKVEQYLPLAELTEYCWDATDDEDVTEKLNKAPFKVTNEHITSLNKRKRKRTFVLKDGKVICLTKSGGMLSKLDLDIQKKQTRGAATFAMINV